jgi:CIC family chloride channel protein
MATVISRSFEGDFAAFQVPKYQLASPYELVFYLILGIGCGLASFAFIKSLYYCEEYYVKKIMIPEYLKPFTGGIGIGLIGLLFPQIMGVGYDSINSALHSNVVWYFAFTLVFIKILATSLTLGSGGIFAPSLFMGAMLGKLFGSFVHSTFPDMTGTPGAYALVAMGGMVAGTTRAPITAIIIVFELTNDYRIILPLMITCLISMIISTKLSRESIYTLKLLLRNIGIREGVETNAMESIFVKDVYIRDFDFINITDNFNLVVNKVIKGRGPEFPVLNANGNIVGIISLYDIKEILLDKDLLKDLLIAEDLLNHNFEILHIDDNCQTALDKMSKYDLEGLPVTENIRSNKILGMLWRKDIQDAYQKEIERREISVNPASSIQMKDEETQFHFMEGYSITKYLCLNLSSASLSEDWTFVQNTELMFFQLKYMISREQRLKQFQILHIYLRLMILWLLPEKLGI